MRHPLPFSRHGVALACTAALLALSACGGGGDGGGGGTSAGASGGLSGTVAVGAPISGGKLKVIDANGTVVASDVTIDENGHYENVALTGTAPYRLEACGHAGPNYTCVYSVAGGTGTANVTPLTTATVLLAAGQAPGTLMTGTVPALTTTSLAQAQTQLRDGLSTVLASAGVPSSFDFISGSLTAGSRSGYDGVLDAVGVATGEDSGAFVQITPRLGSGNLYFEPGAAAAGTISAAPSAASLQLGGLEALFRNMTQSIDSASACANPNTGLARSMASNARISEDGSSLTGAAQVAGFLCGFFGGGEDGETSLWGSRLLSPTLGKCDLSGAQPVCGVSFVLASPEGDVMPVGNGMGVTRESGEWKFLGELLPIGITASARAQRTVRIDTDAPVFDYDRAIAFEVTAVTGLACAQVSQRNTAGNPVTMGYFKRHPGATQQERLSLWTADGFSNTAGLDPLTGSTRSADDSWLALPQGAAGDAAIRNFYRGGRSVSVALFSDAACSVPFTVAGQSTFEVEVEGVPPVWSAMPTLPWPEIDAATRAAIRDLSIAGGAEGSLSAAWTFPNGPLGIDGATVCGSRATCGEGGTGRLAERQVRPGARNVALSLANAGTAVTAQGEKTLALSGRSGEGVSLQSNYSSCPGSAPNAACH